MTSPSPTQPEPSADPLQQFLDELSRARATEPLEGSICALATSTTEGRPSVRFVLLKEATSDGFVFYTNYRSRKARELAENPYASLAFHWTSIGVQARIEGRVEKVSETEADAYFASRPRESQLGAWASQQSEELASRSALLEAFERQQQTYEGKDVPRPAHWGGYRLVPDRIELWYDREYRLHDRFEYRRSKDGWTCARLNP